MTLITLNGFVLIDNIQKQGEMSEGGIYVGESDKDLAPATGTIVSVPVETETGVEKGDIVMFKVKAAQPIKLDNKVYYLISEKSLMGIVVSGN